MEPPGTVSPGSGNGGTPTEVSRGCVRLVVKALVQDISDRGPTMFRCESCMIARISSVIGCEGNTHGGERLSGGASIKMFKSPLGCSHVLEFHKDYGIVV